MKAKLENITTDDLKKAKKSKVKKPRDIRSMFRESIANIIAAGGVSSVKKTWMSTKAFYIIDTPNSLQEWVDDVLANAPRFDFYGNMLPVVALDTETLSLDTRLFVRLHRLEDGTYRQTYEVKTDISGICLSADGIKGIYIPLTHEFQDLGLSIPARNMDRKACAEILQKFFDQVHLIFYNAKFDKEILRLTMGITFRPYPFFEDVQALQYINDPKADMEDKRFYTGDSGGLKSLSKNVLGIEQIELEDIAKVRADTCPDTGRPFCLCTFEDKKEKKHGLKQHFCPFSWIPVELALWYAASDAICTWMLWAKLHELARSRRTIHRIDHELVDSITWIERQRYFIDVERHARTVKGHQKKLAKLRKHLYDLGIAAGFEEKSTDEGEVLEKDRFNPGSNQHLQKLFFEVKKWTPTKRTPKGGISCDAEVIEDLIKLHPDDEFLASLLDYRDYQAIHPADLRFDPSDNSARLYLKGNVVAGGRLSSAGGEFEKDGGFGMNSQAVKKVEGYLMWKVLGNVLMPDEIPEDQIEHHEESELHPSCFREVKVNGELVRKQAPGIIHNHIGQYMGYAICLVPGCQTCADKFGILIPKAKMDANETVNIRCLFHSLPGYTFFTVDYGNIEMRAAANCSGEPEFIKEFLHGKGDFHSLTASKVFPEFNDPKTSKADRKRMRDLAKIINFALLYGGTAHAIYENMRKQDPTITREQAQKMVADYWAGVPKFYEFCQNKQLIAREQLICTTTTGRVVNFQSAMDALHIRKPTEEENKNYWQYRDLMRQAKECFKNEGDQSPQGLHYQKIANSMWKNPDTGVRNAMDYNKFMGKIQRVAVSVPIQGLAGDFMRMSLNKLRQWVESDPPVHTIFILHGSVHDEIDFSAKDEYAPFILPRVTRIMKLRKLHEKLKWPVGIETDAEYGPSWDVENHVTGDDDHAPAAWTKIKALENYLPPGWDSETVRNLIKAIASGDERRVSKAKKFLFDNIHPRAHNAVDYCLTMTVNDKNGKRQVPRTDSKDIKTALIATLQLDEFWRIDETPDGQEDKLETLEQYEARMGLTPADRNPAALIYGTLGSLPLDASVVRPKFEALGVFVAPPEPVPQQGILNIPLPSPTPEKAVSAPPMPIPSAPPEDAKVWELADLTDDQAKQLMLRLGKGKQIIWVKLGTEVFHIKSKRKTVPEEFLKPELDSSLSVPIAEAT